MNRILFLFFVIPFFSFAQFKNILLAEQKDGSYPPVEPSITINRANPKNIVAGIVLDQVVTTHDGGATWKTSTLKSPFGVAGDPALISNAKGVLFYFHLSDPSAKGRGHEAWLDRIVCQRSYDEGLTWTDESSIGNNSPKDQDKAWPAVYPKKHFMCVTWTQFDEYGSDNPSCQSQILFSKSANGTNWSKPTIISETAGNCQDKSNTAEGAVPVIGSDGKIYVAWANQGNIYFDRSYDNGKTWLQNDLIIAKQEAGWNFSIPGVDRTNGLPVLTMDNTEGRYKGTMYLVWADQKKGGNDTDIWLIRSRSRGDYWGKPQRINQDSTHAHQFLPWITVDQTTGYVYLVYYDRSEYDDDRTDVHLAYSIDGGNHFMNLKISDSPFTPDATHFFGDYINIDAHAGLITPIWTRMDKGYTSVWTALIKQDELIKPIVKETLKKKK